MKKILPIILIACIITVLTCACNKGPDLNGVAISELAITQTAYQREEKWVAAQGLATDGTYFYYAGHHDKTNEAADIHVIDATTFQEVRTFSRAGAMHSAELYYNKERGTLFACSGGDKRKPYVYELNIADGSRHELPPGRIRFRLLFPPGLRDRHVFAQDAGRYRQDGRSGSIRIICRHDKAHGHPIVLEGTVLVSNPIRTPGHMGT